MEATHLTQEVCGIKNQKNNKKITIMIYNHSKIESIFKYYLNSGFDHSMQEIASAVQVSKKTLFNRYLSKESLEYCLIDYWQIKSCERFAERIEHTNNAVEQLMMFLFELQYCRNNEFHFFEKTKEPFLRKFERTSPPFITQLEAIFKTGTTEGFFQFSFELKVFAYFFLFNALFILLSNTSVNTDYISFLFEPILTEEGKMVFKDIDIEQVFKP